MELQWPLILFTAFVAWSTGLFATQGIFALRNESAKSQMPALIASVALLAIGGIAVFFHLEHWERIFNGFGHLTSGITQELICVVIMIVVAIVLFAFIRKDAANIPSWLSILVIVVAIVTAAVTAHSYMMAARPVWNSFLWVACVVGNACVLGPLTFGIIDALRDKTEGEKPLLGNVVFIGSIVGAAATAAYVLSLATVGGSFESIGYYYDPTEPMREMVEATDVANIFSAEYALLVWVGALIIGALVPVAAGVMAKRKSVDASLLTWCAIGLVAALVGAICVRVVFFLMGASVFIFY